MAEKERLGLAQARDLDVQNTLSLAGVPVTASAADLNAGTGNGAVIAALGLTKGGRATITGSGTVASGLTAITSAVAVLGADAALTGLLVSATWSGATITLKVWKPTGTGDVTPIASTTAVAVNWIAWGT